MSHIFNPNRGNNLGGRDKRISLWVQGQPVLNSGYQNDIKRPCLKNTQNTQKQNTNENILKIFCFLGYIHLSLLFFSDVRSSFVENWRGWLTALCAKTLFLFYLSYMFIDECFAWNIYMCTRVPGAFEDQTITSYYLKHKCLWGIM